MAPSKAATAPYSKDERVLCFHHEMLYRQRFWTAGKQRIISPGNIKYITRDGKTRKLFLKILIHPPINLLHDFLPSLFDERPGNTRVGC